jgi:hypothetical protein
MPLARFLPAAFIEIRDAAMMREVLGNSCRRGGRRWPREARSLAGRVTAQLESLEKAGVQSDLDTMCVAKDGLLDMAADLLDASGALHKIGRHVDAMVLEGVEARLLESLLGAGPVEPAS